MVMAGRAGMRVARVRDGVGGDGGRGGADGVRQGVLSEEAMVPYGDELVYPEDWVDLTRRRVGE